MYLSRVLCVSFSDAAQWLTRLATCVHVLLSPEDLRNDGAFLYADIIEHIAFNQNLSS